jgi:hypothetical protein
VSLVIVGAGGFVGTVADVAFLITQLQDKSAAWCRPVRPGFDRRWRPSTTRSTPPARRVRGRGREGNRQRRASLAALEKAGTAAADAKAGLDAQSAAGGPAERASRLAR